MDERNSYKRGMVVVAHPDDAEFGCSGTIAKWCRQGMEVVQVICTDGSKGSSDPMMTPQSLQEIRYREQQAAARVLGVKEVVFLGHEDSMLQPTLELRRDIAREIRRHRPQVVICQPPVRNLFGNGHIGHPDHIAAGEATLSAVFPAARDRLTFPELLKEGLEPHKVREVLISDREHADAWIDVTDYLDVAIEALRQHKSQLGSWNVADGMRKWRARTGESKDMTYAEAFKSFKFQVDEEVE
jgi:LmbE family N-acetylglucosaminyl deacetylase